MREGIRWDSPWDWPFTSRAGGRGGARLLVIRYWSIWRRFFWRTPTLEPSNVPPAVPAGCTVTSPRSYPDFSKLWNRACPCGKPLLVESDCTSSSGKVAQATTLIGKMHYLRTSLQARPIPTTACQKPTYVQSAESLPRQLCTWSSKRQMPRFGLRRLLSPPSATWRFCDSESGPFKGVNWQMSSEQQRRPRRELASRAPCRTVAINEIAYIAIPAER